MNLYQRNGFQDRQDYLKFLAEDTGLDFDTVFTVADLLGPDEDFDGLLTALQARLED